MFNFRPWRCDIFFLFKIQTRRKGNGLWIGYCYLVKFYWWFECFFFTNIAMSWGQFSYPKVKRKTIRKFTYLASFFAYLSRKLEFLSFAATCIELLESQKKAISECSLIIGPRKYKLFPHFPAELNLAALGWCHTSVFTI